MSYALKLSFTVRTMPTRMFCDVKLCNCLLLGGWLPASGFIEDLVVRLKNGLLDT